jgi:hypothetical protein
MNPNSMTEEDLWDHIRQDFPTTNPSSQVNENLAQQTKILKQLKNEAILQTRRHETEINKLKSEMNTLRTCYDTQTLQVTTLQDKLVEQKIAFARKTKKVANFLKATLENKETHKNSLNIVMMAAQVEKQSRSRKKLENDLYKESPTANRYPDRVSKRRALVDRMRLGEKCYIAKPASTTQKPTSSSRKKRSKKSRRKRSPETKILRPNKKLKKPSLPPLPIDIISRTTTEQKELTNSTTSLTESTDPSSSANESTTTTEPEPSLDPEPEPSLDPEPGATMNETTIVDLTQTEEKATEQKHEVTITTLSVSKKYNSHGFCFLGLKNNYKTNLLLHVNNTVDHNHQQKHNDENNQLPVHRRKKTIITQYTSPNELDTTDEHSMIHFLITGTLINNLFSQLANFLQNFSQLANFLQTKPPKRWIGETV